MKREGNGWAFCELAIMHWMDDAHSPLLSAGCSSNARPMVACRRTAASSGLHLSTPAMATREIPGPSAGEEGREEVADGANGPQPG